MESGRREMFLMSILAKQKVGRRTWNWKWPCLMTGRWHRLRIHPSADCSWSWRWPPPSPSASCPPASSCSPATGDTRSLGGRPRPRTGTPGASRATPARASSLGRPVRSSSQHYRWDQWLINYLNLDQWSWFLQKIGKQILQNLVLGIVQD